MDFTQERVVAYEPHPGEPPASDALEVEILGKQRRRLINSLVVYVVLGAVLLVLNPDVVSFSLVGVLGVVTLLVLWALVFRLRPARKLLHYPAVLLTPGQGQLLVKGSTVSVALPGPEPRWVVVRLPRSKRILLAGTRRMYLIGPDPRGRVMVALPGGITGRFGRVRPAPATGSAEPVVPSRHLVPAAQDPVVTAFMREVWARAVAIVVVLVVVAAGVWAVGSTAFDGHATGTPMTVLAVVYVVLALTIPLRTAGLAAAVRSQHWQELYAELYTAIEPGATGGSGKAEGRVLLADGEAKVRFTRQPLDLLVNIRASGRLWVLGTPQRGKRVVVGLPGYPVLGLVKLG
ncbi:hypothetical protein [Amycolatopsis thermophila]|uniref:PH domain-containing protein n=1 Tax=Amycolatopsis thermophila TaxID=206084 RepID=A0ABU0ERX6_9PSEU|nr:hypothetical protein [Amycolatopsis thermophila]MDQ0378046.1 hypothetical protein [Amycolatopsis thermophila]